MCINVLHGIFLSLIRIQIYIKSNISKRFKIKIKPVDQSPTVLEVQIFHFFYNFEVIIIKFNPQIQRSMNKISCGFDIHKNSIFYCILGKDGEKIYECRFETLTPELDKLRDTLITYGCGHVAMESISIYRIPVWNTLQWDFQLKVETCQSIFYQVVTGQQLPLSGRQ
jgi:hypothetical protein